MHVIDVDRDGRVTLLPYSSWHFEGDAHPRTWTVRATFYGPSTSTTRNLPYEGVVFVRWGSTPGQPYVGTGPLSWAHTTARLQSETERSLADEAGGPLAQLLAIPQDGGDDSEDDPMAALKADVRTARGRALLVETVVAGWGEGRGSAPQRDWQASRLGPNPPESLAMIRRDTFEAVLAATGRRHPYSRTRTGPRNVRPSGAGTLEPCSPWPGSWMLSYRRSWRPRSG